MAKVKKVFLKQKRVHQHGYRLGRYIINSGAPKEYELNEAEQKELKGKGAKAWLIEVSKKSIDNAPKSNQENKQIQDLKKKLDGKVKLNGDESLTELKEMI